MRLLILDERDAIARMLVCWIGLKALVEVYGHTTFPVDVDDYDLYSINVDMAGASDLIQRLKRDGKPIYLHSCEKPINMAAYFEWLAIELAKEPLNG